jgi:hypothetical protein
MVEVRHLRAFVPAPERTLPPAPERPPDAAQMGALSTEFERHVGPPLPALLEPRQAS